MTALYVPGVEETDTKKLIRSQQLVASQTSTNTTNTATNTASIATNTTNVATNTANITTLQTSYPSAKVTGTTTNDSATAGNIGEYISSTVAAGSAVSLTTATAANVTSISLTAGDWDVAGQVYFTFGASTSGTVFQSGISTTTATLDTTAGQWNEYGTNTALVPGAFNETFGPVGPLRVSIASTTTIYLVAQASFTVSTMKAWGIIRARRVR